MEACCGNGRIITSEAKKTEKKQTEASVASLKISGGTDIYYLNTQDNSLAYNKASYKLTDNGAVFSYDIFTDEKTAAKASYDKNDIGFNLTVNVTLADGSVIVTMTHKNITGNPDAYIEDIELLNYFEKLSPENIPPTSIMREFVGGSTIL